MATSEKLRRLLWFAGLYVAGLVLIGGTIWVLHALVASIAG